MYKVRVLDWIDRTFAHILLIPHTIIYVTEEVEIYCATDIFEQRPCSWTVLHSILIRYISEYYFSLSLSVSLSLRS